MQPTWAMQSARAALAAALLLASSSLWAAEWRLDAGDGLGTMGAEPTMQLQSPFSESLRLRLGLAASRFDTYVGDAALLGTPTSGSNSPMASALLDFHLPRWGLRLTGGALYGSQLDQPLPQPTLDGFSQEPAMYDGRYISLADRSGQRDEFQPYLGLGWNQAFGTEERLQLKMDFGVAFQGVTDLNGADGTEGSLSGSRGDTYLVNDQLRIGDQFQSLRYSFSAGLQYRF